jgi:hypothetical protein
MKCAECRRSGASDRSKKVVTISATRTVKRVLRKAKKSPAAIWGWLTRQSPGVQTLVGIVGVVIALVALIIASGSTGKSRGVTLRRSPLSLVSSNDSGTAANADSGRPALSGSGRFVVFTSAATNLAPVRFPPGYGYHNIYVKDRVTGAIRWVSMGRSDQPPNGESQFPAICPEGRLVAFASDATNLAAVEPRLSGSRWRVYVHDYISGRTYMVSVAQDGQDSNGLSVNPQFNANCTRLVFESTSSDLVAGDTNNSTDVFERLLFQHKTILISHGRSGPANSASFSPAINRNGTLVAFTSWATNMPDAVPGQPSVYLADTRTMKIVSVSAPFRGMETRGQGFSWPSFSPDGRYLVFRSLENATTSRGGPAVLLWDVRRHRSAIPGLGSGPAGWTDGCTTGIDNGTDFSPYISEPGRGHSYLVMFTVRKGSACTLVLRDSSGADIPVRLDGGSREILEPSLDSSGDVIAWDVAGRPQLVYACKLRACTQTSS